MSKSSSEEKRKSTLEELEKPLPKCAIKKKNTVLYNIIYSCYIVCFIAIFAQLHSRVERYTSKIKTPQLAVGWVKYQRPRISKDYDITKYAYPAGYGVLMNHRPTFKKLFFCRQYAQRMPVYGITDDGTTCYLINPMYTSVDNLDTDSTEIFIADTKKIQHIDPSMINQSPECTPMLVTMPTVDDPTCSRTQAQDCPGSEYYLSSAIMETPQSKQIFVYPALYSNETKLCYFTVTRGNSNVSSSNNCSILCSSG